MSLVYLQQESTPPHPDSIWALQWTAKNNLVSGCSDGHIRIWDPSELAKPIHNLSTHPLAITSLSTTADGQYVLGTSLDGSVVLVDTVEGTIAGKVDTGREKVGGENAVPAFTAAIHPEMKCWAWSGRSSKLAVRSIESSSSSETNGESSHPQGRLAGGGKIIDTAKGRFGMDVQFSPDGKSIALSSELGHVSIIDTETQAVVATYNSHAMAVRTVSWSLDSQMLFSGSDDHRIVIHDVRAGSKTSTGGRGEGAVAGMLQGHQGWVLKVSASPDGKLLGSGSSDNLVKLWDIASGQCVSTISSSTPAEVWGVAWQPSAAASGEGGFGVGKQFAVAGDDKAVTTYRAAGSV